VARQVGRRGAQQAAVGGDAARDHPRVGRGTEADADIEGLLRQRGRVDRQLQLHLHLRVLLDEARDHRRHVAAAEAERGVDAQQALWRALGGAEQALHVVDLAQDAARVLEIGFALGRQAHAAGRAHHQRQPEARLHLRQALAHRRRR
jgi:hypothetical protein